MKGAVALGVMSRAWVVVVGGLGVGLDTNQKQNAHDRGRFLRGGFFFRKRIFFSRSSDLDTMAYCNKRIAVRARI